MAHTATNKAPRLLHPPVVGFGAALLIGALVTDVFHTQTLLFQWNNFSIWLITFGLILAAVAGLALVLDLLLCRAGPVNWLRFALVTIAALLSLLNAFVHSRDAYTAVVPQGLELSVIVTMILLVVVWQGCSIAPRHVHIEGGRS